jgi:hypothetical protein
VSDYLKDSSIPYLTIGLQELDAINSDLHTIADDTASLVEGDRLISNTYTLRYDGMGIVRKDYSEIRRCFETGGTIERVIFDFSCAKNIAKNKGKRVQM